jgi:tetratricopeptide (TPR) repeat protein
MARMARAGQPQDAINYARRALTLNRSAGDKNEEANSLRLIADAAFKLEDFKTARLSYDDALRLDKDTGSATKIALDLMGLGRSIARQDRKAEAMDISSGLIPSAKAWGMPKPRKRPRRKSRK